MDRYQQSSSEPEPMLGRAQARDDARPSFASRPATHGLEAGRSHARARRDEDEDEAAGSSRALDPRFAPLPPPTPRVPTEADVAAFTDLVLAGSMPAVMDFVEAAHADGVPIDALYVDLLEPAARRLGELWRADLCSFAEVTMATARLQLALRETSALVPLTVECVQHGRRLLLTPAGGEQHTFGLLIVADLFTRKGWDVWGGARPGNEVLKLVKDEWFDVVGLSVGCVPRLGALTAEIRRIRSSSSNRNLGVMVGGSVFVAHPEYVARVGADASAIDGRQATNVAEALVAARTGPC
jgi:MerR family transcriptional regulator, light-induced transcriptional regulator